jgi:hypothetical protein
MVGKSWLVLAGEDWLEVRQSRVFGLAARCDYPLFGGNNNDQAKKEGKTHNKPFTQVAMRIEKQVQHTSKKLYKRYKRNDVTNVFERFARCLLGTGSS